MLTIEQKEAVCEHLRKVLASVEFARSERAAAFLRHVVVNALDDAAEPLKERAIGIAVFGRPHDWDPKLDTTVRTEARRVRRKLADFYSSAAAEGEFVRIDVPVGGYVPTLNVAPPSPLHNGAQAVLFDSPELATVDGSIRLLPTRHALQGVHPRHRNWTRVGLAFAAAAVCTVLVTILLSNHARTSAKGQQFETLPFTSEYGNAFDPSVSPDGSDIAYVWDRGGGEFRIYLKPVKGGPSRRLTNGSSSELDPAWSPDGKHIAFLRVKPTDTDVIVRDVADGAERIIGSISTQLGDWTGTPGPLLGNLGPSWTPDGQHVMVGDSPPHSISTGLFSIRISDGARQQLTTTAGSTRDFSPRVSPDGRVLAFVRAISHGISDIYLLDLEKHRLKQLTREAHSINGLTWFRGSNRLAFSSDREGAFQLWTVSPTDGVITKINSDSTTAMDPQSAQGLDWLAFVATSQNWNIDRIALENNSAMMASRFIASSGRNHSARYSPDGKHIAFVSDRSGAWEIWLCDLACSEPKMLTHFRGPWIGGLSWSPDSRNLAFDARLGRNSAIFKMSIGDREPTVIEENSFEERMPTWAADGKSLYFNSDRDGSISIWKRDLASGTVSKIGAGFAAREMGASGFLLVGHSDGTLWRISPDGTNVKLPTEVVANPVLAWTTHGERVYFCVPDSNIGVRVMEFGDQHVRLIADLVNGSPRTSASLDIAPDGRTLLITSVDHSSSNIYRRIDVQ